MTNQNKCSECQQENSHSQLCSKYKDMPYQNKEVGWKEKFNRNFVTNDGRLNEENPLIIKDFIEQTILQENKKAYEKGKQDGMAEEAVGCYEHTQNEIKEAVDKRVEEIREEIDEARGSGTRLKPERSKRVYESFNLSALEAGIFLQEAYEWGIDDILNLPILNPLSNNSNKEDEQ